MKLDNFLLKTMLTILIFLIVLAGLLGAYTTNFQKTTLSIGKKLAPDNEFLPRGMQDAITPESQNIRNILFPILILAVLIVGLLATRWYFAILITLGTFIFVTQIFQRFMPEPESIHYLNAIRKGLTKKLELYKAKNDTERMYAATSVLEDLNKLENLKIGRIESIGLGQARIIIDDFCIRLFVRYKKEYCSDIRIWKVPKYNNLFSMFNTKNLFWAVCDDEAECLHGWFYKDGDLLNTLANKIKKCSTEEDLKSFCLNLENIITKGTPLDIDGSSWI